MDSLKVIDLFSGAGGLSQGFRDAGCNIISAVEINKNLSQTFRNNFKKTKIFEEDISKVKSSLGWKPKWGFEETIKKTCIWYKEYLLKNDIKNITLKQINDYLDIS